MYSATAWGHWLDAAKGPACQPRPMLLDLTDAELATAVTACRALAHWEGERAKRMENPLQRGRIESAAKRYAALAEVRGGTRAEVDSRARIGKGARE